MKRLIATTVLAGTLGAAAIGTATTAGAAPAITPIRPICAMLSIKESQARDEAAYWAQKAQQAEQQGNDMLAMSYVGRSAAALREALEYHQDYVDAGC